MSSAPVDVNKRTIRHLAQSKWQASGLTDKAAHRLRFKALNAHQVTSLNPRFKAAGSLLIPYFDLAGKLTRFYRIRYLERLPGMDGQLAKPQKYDQLPVMQEVYYPPLMKRSWRQIADDPDTAIGITEGELKAACATYTQILPTMALGGVYSFMSSKRGIDLLPSMRQFTWEGRQVYIIYDNDLANNPEVVRAQRILAERLLSEGAHISFGNIPQGPAKGIDDFIVAHGTEAFEDILKRATPFGEGSALWGMNEEVVYIRPPVDAVIERSSSIVMDPNRFVKHAYVNRFFMQEVEVGSGKNRRVTIEKAPLAARWLEWEQRAELERLTYEPGHPKVHDRAWNLWDGWGVKPKRGDVEPWHWLMGFLFGKDHKTRSYFEHWCAYPIQNPGAKMYSAVVMWSHVKRLGKSMAALALSKIYGENAVFVNSRQLRSEFNTWAKNKQFVVGEEIASGEKKIDADYLKYIITHPTFTIRDLYTPEYVIPNHTNFMFLSNHQDAMYLEDGDKRYLIHAVPQRAPAPREKYEWCDKWLHNDGPSHLMDYLLRLKLNGFNPREHAPDTMSKYQMIVAGKTDVGLWVLKLREDPASALKPLGEAIASGCDLFSAEQLHRAFDPEGKWVSRGVLSSLGKSLSSSGFPHVNHDQPVQTGDKKIHRLIAVRNTMDWEQATRAEIREHYDKFFGPQKAGEVK